MFNGEFLETLEILQSKRLQVYLCGDYNANLLKVFKKDQYNIFFENLVSAGYLPKISNNVQYYRPQRYINRQYFWKQN